MPHSWKAPLYVCLDGDITGHSFFLSNNAVAHNDRLYRGSARVERGQGKRKEQWQELWLLLQRDANLWECRLKTALFALPSRIATTNLPNPNSNPINSIRSSPWFITCEWLRTLHEVLYEVQTITIRFYDWNGEFIFVSGKIHAKMPQKPNYESKKIRIFGENGINFKLKHRKAHNSILSGRFGDPYGRPGDWCRIQETPG